MLILKRAIIHFTSYTGLCNREGRLTLDVVTDREGFFCGDTQAEIE